MKSAFTIACFAAINCAEASLLEKAFEQLRKLPFTVDEAQARFNSNGNMEFATHPILEHSALQAHHNIMAQRERLGLPRSLAGEDRDF